MTFDPERWRQRWLTLVTAMTALTLGAGVLIYEVVIGHDKEFARMAIALIMGGPAAIAAGKRKP